MTYGFNFDVGPAENYVVRELKHGWVVTGHISARAASSLMLSYGDEALIVPGVAAALNAMSAENVVFAIAKDADSSEAWHKELDERATRRANGDRAKEWAMGTDTGNSSMTIYNVMTGKSGVSSLPSDNSDFGRCRRLINKLPEWRDRLGEVADSFPEWGPIIDGWDDLVSMYDDGKLDKLDEFLGSLDR